MRLFFPDTLLWLWSQVLTVRKGCLVFCNTLLSVTVWATSSCSKNTRFAAHEIFYINKCNMKTHYSALFLEKTCTVPARENHENS